MARENEEVMTEIRRNARPICGAKNGALQCFRDPHYTVEHVAETGEGWSGCRATRHKHIKGTSSSQVMTCMKPDEHDGPHEDEEMFEWWNDRCWEYVDQKDVRAGDIVRDLAFGEPIVVFSANDAIHYQGGTMWGSGWYRLKARGFHGKIVTTKIESVPIATFRDILRAFWMFLRLKFTRKR